MTVDAIETEPISQAETAYRALRDMLVRLDIAPGSPLTEAAVTARLGIGRTPLREAIHRLEAERLVIIHPRRGTFAADINLADLSLITDLREELEGHAAERAAQRATAAEREALGDLSSELDEPGAAGQLELDTRVHRAVYRASHNHFLEDTATVYHNLSTRIWHVYRDRIPDLGSHVAEHHELLDAIARGEAGAARSVAVAHVRNFASAVTELF